MALSQRPSLQLPSQISKFADSIPSLPWPEYTEYMAWGKEVKGKYHSWDIPGTLLGAFTFTTSFNVHNKNVTVPPSVQKDSEFFSAALWGERLSHSDCLRTKHSALWPGWPDLGKGQGTRDQTFATFMDSLITMLTNWVNWIRQGLKTFKTSLVIPG